MTNLRRGLAAGVALFAATPVLAHSPLLSCFPEGDGTIFCEAGYSDGARAGGAEILIVDAGGRVLFTGTLAEDSTIILTPPDVDDYEIRFVGDSAHSASVYSDEL